MKLRNCVKCNEEFFTKAKVGRAYSYCKSCISAQRKADWKKNKKKISAQNRLSHIKNKYGLTKSEYDKMYSDQNGLCAICSSPFGTVRNKKTLAIDHDHDTGKVRGLLCQQCNTGLGLFKDNEDLLEKALKYLKAEK